jgi:hypothetical protein
MPNHSRNEVNSLMSDDEVRGDWSNLKGTDYHLVYALWLLICERASGVFFYQGNDLLVSPTTPPYLKAQGKALPLVPLHIGESGADIWIQLKASREPWTVSNLLKENLLLNFICNAIQSQRKGRSWRALLITQGLVKQREIEAFTDNPAKFSRSYKKIKEIILKAVERLQMEGDARGEFEEEAVFNIALSILNQLAESEPKHIETLKAEIERELAFAYPDPLAVRQIADSLLGALLRAAAAGPSMAQVYDADWLNLSAGRPIKKRGLLDTNPVAACVEASRSALPKDWDADCFAPRTQLENALRQFLKAREPLFVLVGPSGTGKSWAIADWVTHSLSGQIHLLIPGSELDYLRTLEDIIAGRFRTTFLGDWRDEMFVHRLQAAASVQGHGPFVVIIEDLIPSGEISVFRRDLARLVNAARAHGIKLVFTCQRHLWELYQLSADIIPFDIFSAQFTPDQHKDKHYNSSSQEDNKPILPATKEGECPQKSFSFLLGDLSLDEMQEIISRQLSSVAAESLANQLRAPAFAVLRNPYFLKLYLEQNLSSLDKSDWKSPSVDVNALLDMRVQRLVERVAKEIICNLEDLNLAFDSILSDLWTNRPHGLSYTKALNILGLYLGDQAPKALELFRRVELFTAQGQIRLAEPLVAEHLFAKRLIGEQYSNERLLVELRPAEDTGVVVALLRAAPSAPIPFAELLIESDTRWMGAVTEGMAQRQADDFKTLALLSAIARPKSRSILNRDACNALGQLAARGRRAWEWVAGMYLGEDSEDRYRGAHSLAATIKLEPRRVGALVRLRLSKAGRMKNFFSEDQKRRKDYLINALDPLMGIDHKSSARVGERLLKHYSSLAGEDEDRLDYRFLEDIDEIRGRIAIVNNGRYLQSIITELFSIDRLTRFRAACAIRIVCYEQPEKVLDALCQAIEYEENSTVLTRLLWAAYRLIEVAPEKLLSALEAGPIKRWDSKQTPTGPLLGLLGNLADRQPERVYLLLPRHLENYDPENRAYYSEMLAYAWWRCAQYIPEARERLDTLTYPDLLDVPDEFRPFAIRGAAVALLGKMLLENVPAAELAERSIMFTRWGYHFLFTDQLVKQHLEALMAHQDYERLRELLLQCVNEEEKVQVHPIKKVLFQIQYYCASLCVEMIIHFAVRTPDPLPTLNSMPRDWQALRMAWRLLEAGRLDEAIINFTREVCDEHSKKTTAQGISEKENCLAQLARLEPEPVAALELHEMRMRRGSFSLFGGQERAARSLAILTDDHPDELLSTLDDTLQGEDDLPTLFHWEAETHSWRSLLMARVYKRMFNPHPISLPEAHGLCEEMLAAITSLPPSSRRQGYESAYKAIANQLSRNSGEIHTFSTSTSPIQDSQDFALLVLQRELQSRGQDNPQSLLTELLSKRRGWWETDKYSLKNGGFSMGSSHYLVYLFPAVRLALLTFGQYHNLPDPAATFMSRRIRVSKVYKKHSWVFDSSSQVSNSDFRKVLNDLEEEIRNISDDERLWEWKGGLLLRMKQLVEAEEALLKCLSMLFCTGNIRGSAFYDLSCVYARSGKEEDCRQALIQSSQIRKLDKEWMMKDPDLESVRERPWFKAMVVTENDI